MPRFETRNSFRVLGATAFVLLAGVLYSPRSAEAACGDYVWVGGRAPHPMTGHATRDVHSSVDESKAPSTPRCSGPFCSKGSLPPAAPVPSIKVTFERWACVDVVVNGHASCSTRSTYDLGESPTEGFGQGILRPPR